MLRFSLVAMSFSFALLGCVEMAQKNADRQAKEYCAAQGKTPVPIQKKVSGGLVPRVAEALVCVDEKQLVATNAVFGADLLPDPRVKGALVIHVLPGSCAARVGLRTNDLVYEYNGHSIESAADLQQAVAQPPKPGETVTVKWARNLVEMSGSTQAGTL
jgi:S1-C subfamily serine protease